MKQLLKYWLVAIAVFYLLFSMRYGISLNNYAIGFFAASVLVSGVVLGIIFGAKKIAQ